MRRSIPLIAVAILLVVGLSIIISLIATKNQPQDITGNTIQHVEVKQSYEKYGQEIPGALVEEKYAQLSEESKQQVTREEIAESLATEKLLVQKAEQNAIEVTDDEVSNFIQDGLKQYSITQEEYQARLAAAGITEQEYEAQLKRQIEISKLINESITPEQYAVSDAEVDDFIEQHKEDYSDLLSDEAFMDVLRERIKQQMVQKKKTDLVKAFIENLTNSQTAN
ncbi:MAG: SurA N-terminal domain-containing protein [Candidatus Woesearchaeota archaeon]